MTEALRLNTHVALHRRDGVAIVEIDNPPVNALKQEVRQGLLDALKAARDDGAVDAVVVACAGRTFVAGADITEFGKPPQPPHLRDVIEALDDMPKPVVAAIHGTALGGGLELALACHYRIAAPTARLGLPEVKLGLLPGAGGTQRLPRATGPEKALRMIVTGDPVGADDALQHGLIDSIAAGDLVDEAVAYARKVADEGGPLPRLRDRDDKLAAARADREALERTAKELTARARGLEAPHACVEAVRMSLDLDFDAALARERELFETLLEGDQSKAQRYLFFAEREAARVPGIGKDVKPRTIDRVAVIGAGTMGSGIAMSFANSGIPVRVIEASDDALEAGMNRISKTYAGSVSRGRLTEDEMRRRLDLVAGATDIASVADADLVIEAVFEELELKKSVFRNLDKYARPGAILATNTSYLDVNEIARATSRPADVLGTHFFSPANVMRLVEIVRGEATAPDVLVSAIATARRLGKVPVVVGVCHGFVGNRMLGARTIEAERLLLEGALPQDVDGALVDFGFPMGSFAMHDLAGLDISWRMRKAQGLTSEIADALCEMGRFGQKTGRGFYIYEKGSRTPVPDPEVARLIEEASARHGIERRSISAEEIVERLLYPMVSEGAQILDEGIAHRPGDIDVIWVYGYGWPVWRGGPMYWADTVGLGRIRDRLEEFAERSGDTRLRPAPLLVRLANEGRSFASLAEEKKSAA